MIIWERDAEGVERWMVRGPMLWPQETKKGVVGEPCGSWLRPASDEEISTMESQCA